MSKVILETNIPELKLIKKGKVRDIYEIDNDLLIVATDRISAFDVVFKQGIPFKGMVLTQISKYWFKIMEDIIPNHIISTEVKGYPVLEKYKDELEGRIMVVQKAEPLMVECVIRGYLSGSGWNEYQDKASISGVKLPEGLLESSKLPQTIFTPSTKAEAGIHDENITFNDVKKLIGDKMADKIKEKSIGIYNKAVSIAEKKGIIIADTKFEFGVFHSKLILIDELLTPDSSRFWPMDGYKPGKSQPSFDKQFVRDYLISINWNKKPPAPDLPEEIIKKTSEKYLEALRRIVG
ncbi:MAG: phosphoribosylaminoimidazolesuccinocarboxamide synthase [Candidatus Firestonebacteria bacterium]